MAQPRSTQATSPKYVDGRQDTIQPSASSIALDTPLGGLVLKSRRASSLATMALMVLALALLPPTLHPACAYTLFATFMAMVFGSMLQCCLV